MKNITKTSAILAILSASILNSSVVVAKDDESEKCAGVAKAGQNDCGSVANKHPCAGFSKVDSDPNEWIRLPKGLCERLAGGKVLDWEK